MGGSGGSYFASSSKPEDLTRQVREAEASDEKAIYESQVSEVLTSTLAVYNDRDVAGIQAILDKVKSDLKGEIGDTVDLVFGGSVAKHTYVDGLSDVDALVVIDPADVGRISPGKLKERFAEVLRTRFGRDNVKEGTLAVTIKVDGKEIQLLPAMRDGDLFKIPGAKGRGWSTINPRKFAEALTAGNKAMEGKLVPTIKLAKSIIASFPEPRQLGGYHVEALALEVFRGYRGPKTVKEMLARFFEGASERVREPIREITGQSDTVDEYLGASNSLERRVVSDAMSRVARKLKNADGAKSVSMWRETLEDK